MDLDAFVSARYPGVGPPRRADPPGQPAPTDDGRELDELVLLYQRAATDLSVIRSRPPTRPDRPALTPGRRRTRRRSPGRSGRRGSTLALRDVRFPAELYRLWRWWVSVGVGSSAWRSRWVLWIATHPHVQARLLPPTTCSTLVQPRLQELLLRPPGPRLRFHVWINNAWVAALSLVLGVFLGVPTVLLMFGNAANVGVDGGYMVAAGTPASSSG